MHLQGNFENNLAQAFNLMNSGKINKAINLFESLTKRYPKTARAFHLKAFAYTKDIFEDFTLSLKATITDEFNHIEDNDKHYSGYIGLHYKNLKVGISDATNLSKPSFSLQFRKEF